MDAQGNLVLLLSGHQTRSIHSRRGARTASVAVWLKPWYEPYAVPHIWGLTNPLARRLYPLPVCLPPWTGPGRAAWPDLPAWQLRPPTGLGKRPPRPQQLPWYSSLSVRVLGPRGPPCISSLPATGNTQSGFPCFDLVAEHRVTVLRPCRQSRPPAGAVPPMFSSAAQSAQNPGGQRPRSPSAVAPPSWHQQSQSQSQCRL